MAQVRVSDPDPDPNPVGSVFLPESGSSFQISLDPDPVFKFPWIRTRKPPDPKAKKECGKGSKSNLLEVIY